MSEIRRHELRMERMILRGGWVKMERLSASFIIKTCLVVTHVFTDMGWLTSYTTPVWLTSETTLAMYPLP